MALWAYLIVGYWLGISVSTFLQLLKTERLKRRETIRRPQVWRKPVKKAGGTGGVNQEIAGRPWPHVQIIIPARNEQNDLPNCLDAVLAQDYENFSVLVVDDRSEDATLEIARRYSKADPRVNFRHIDRLPDGWLGKAHAMWTGAQNCSAEWLLFTDADVTLDAWALRAAIGEAVQRDIELLSVWLRIARQGFWPQAVIPICGAILGKWFDAERVNDPSNPTGFANGQFLLVARQAYQRVNGHRAVRDHLIEDVPFGQHAKRQGLRCRFAVGTALGQVHMYSRLRGIIHGFTRIMAGGLQSRLKIALTAIGLTGGSLIPVVAPLILAIGLGGGWITVADRENVHAMMSRTELMAISAVFAVYLLILARIAANIWQMAGCPSRWILVYPLSVTVILGILARSFWLLSFTRKADWRDTHYGVDSRGRIVRWPTDATESAKSP